MAAWLTEQLWLADPKNYICLHWVGGRGDPAAENKMTKQQIILFVKLLLKEKMVCCAKATLKLEFCITRKTFTQKYLISFVIVITQVSMVRDIFVSLTQGFQASLFSFSSASLLASMISYPPIINYTKQSKVGLDTPCNLLIIIDRALCTEQSTAKSSPSTDPHPVSLSDLSL